MEKKKRIPNFENNSSFFPFYAFPQRHRYPIPICYMRPLHDLSWDVIQMHSYISFVATPYETYRICRSFLLKYLHSFVSQLDFCRKAVTNCICIQQASYLIQGFVETRRLNDTLGLSTQQTVWGTLNCSCLSTFTLCCHPFIF